MKRTSVGVSVLVTLLISFAGCDDDQDKQEDTTAFTGQSGGVVKNESDGKRPGSLPDRAGFTPVTDHYGPLYVSAGEDDVRASVIPWSFSWLPAKDTYLFSREDGVQAPLQKYDQYAGLQVEQGAAAEEKAFFEQEARNSEDWEGHCDAWSLASILEPEPSRHVVNGIIFEVGDLKALLVKTYEKVRGVYYGQRFNGRRNDVWDDIYPDQFHRFVQAELFGKKRPFIMDKDPGTPVWNIPIFRAISRISADSMNPSVMHVEVVLVGASPFMENLGSYDYQGTFPLNFIYTYDLFGEHQTDGRFRVTYGEWTGNSIGYHPDFVTAIPEKPYVRGSENGKIDIKLVDQILGK